jgi:hypothetical protein
VLENASGNEYRLACIVCLCTSAYLQVFDEMGCKVFFFELNTTSRPTPFLPCRSHSTWLVCSRVVILPNSQPRTAHMSDCGPGCPTWRPQTPEWPGAWASHAARASGTTGRHGTSARPQGSRGMRLSSSWWTSRSRWMCCTPTPEDGRTYAATPVRALT